MKNTDAAVVSKAENLEGRDLAAVRPGERRVELLLHVGDDERLVGLRRVLNDDFANVSFEEIAHVRRNVQRRESICQSRCKGLYNPDYHN
ncbi:MAG: hypothetical protein Q6373_011025 [Candidatus Sigynarchaeota archaeon]